MAPELVTSCYICPDSFVAMLPVGFMIEYYIYIYEYIVDISNTIELDGGCKPTVI